MSETRKTYADLKDELLITREQMLSASRKWARRLPAILKARI